MSGEEDDTRELYLRAKAIAEEVGLGFLLAMVPVLLPGGRAPFRGRLQFAEREARAGSERLEAAERLTGLAVQRVLPEALLQLDRCEESEQLAGIGSSALASVDDVATQTRARAVHAKVLAAKRDRWCRTACA